MLSNKSNPLSYMKAHGSKKIKKKKKKKIKTKKYWSILDLLLGSLTLVIGCNTHLCGDFSSVDFIWFHFFLGQSGLICCMIWWRNFLSYKGCHGNRKNTFFQLS